MARAVGEALRDTGGRIDVLVNNAGYYAFGPLEETTPDELRAQLETNVVGVHRVTRAVLPAMRARRSGAVVTIGSVSGRVALPMVGPYHASKWALEGMIEALRYELIPFGIRVALVEPGAYKTELHVNEIRSRASGGADSPYARAAGALPAAVSRAPPRRRGRAGRRDLPGGHVSPPQAALVRGTDIVHGRAACARSARTGFTNG